VHIDMIFPPVHDPAMPHSALPLLKAYLQRNSSHTVRCHDLNWQFFKEFVFAPDAGTGLSSFRDKFVQADTVVKGVESGLAFDSWIRMLCTQWGAENPGYNVTFRNFGTPFDRRDPDSIREFAGAVDTPFDTLFDSSLRSVGPVVGINLSVEDQILPAFRFAAKVRIQCGSQSVIIWGGSLLSRIYPVMVEQLPDFWNYLIMREGEVPLLNVLDAIESGRQPISDERIVQKSDSRKFDIVNPFISTSVTAIEDTGYADFSDYRTSEYFSLLPILPVLASRKCYWGKCSFCTIHESWDPLARQRSAQSVAEEVRNLSETYAIRCFRFVDEAMPPDLMREMLPLLGPLGISFEIYAIAERRFRESDFVARLGEAGCRQAYFGLESADEAALMAMGKRINQVRHYSEIFGTCASAGIHVYVYTLFGFPGSSDLAEQKTVNFIAAEESIHSATISSYVPVSGSPFAIENSSLLVHSMRMTEDFENVTVGLQGKDLGDSAQKAAQAAAAAVYSARPDLALTALLNDEMRFSLSSKFGAEFALRAVSSGELDLDALMVEGNTTMRRERIIRSLD
jgi:radical SAM superfamily enzyme YgiQ (UPF0313 family)